VAFTPDVTAFTSALGDPDIERRVRAIVESSLGDYEWVMKFGTESERLAVLRSQLPNLLRALQAKDDQARTIAQQAAYQELRAAFRQNVAVNGVGEVDE